MPTENAVPTMTWQEVEPRLKLTYRQIDYWIRTNAITLQKNAAGSGSKRVFSEEDVWRLEVIERLADLPTLASGLPGELIRIVWDYLKGVLDVQPIITHVYIVGNPRTGWTVQPRLDAADAAVILRVR